MVVPLPQSLSEVFKPLLSSAVPAVIHIQVALELRADIDRFKSFLPDERTSGS